MAGFGLGKQERIRARRDFERIKEQGKRFRTEHFLVNYQLGTGNGVRLGVMVSRKLKKAVARNRCKRLLREFYRLNREEIIARFQIALNQSPGGLDLVMIAYPGAEKLKYREVSQELLAGFEKEWARVKKINE